MALIVLRVVFLLVAGGISALINLTLRDEAGTPPWAPWAVFVVILGIAVAVIVFDIFFPSKRIDTISAIYFGLLVGVLLTYVLTIALTPLLEQQYPAYQTPLQLVIGMVLCYLCISLLLQTKDDFRFLIPYVEFVREVKGFKPWSWTPAS